MYNRENGREKINWISSYNPWTTYRVEHGNIYVDAPGGLTGEQRHLLRTYKMDILEYLTVPPAIRANCLRREEVKNEEEKKEEKVHQIVWRCTPYALWVCECFYDTYHFNMVVDVRPKQLKLLLSAK